MESRKERKSVEQWRKMWNIARALKYPKTPCMVQSETSKYYVFSRENKMLQETILWKRRRGKHELTK
jgi:hypothetical protein